MICNMHNIEMYLMSQDLLLELRTSSVGREHGEDLGTGQSRPPDNDPSVDFWNFGDFEDEMSVLLVTLSHL